MNNDVWAIVMIGFIVILYAILSWNALCRCMYLMDLPPTWFMVQRGPYKGGLVTESIGRQVVSSTAFQSIFIWIKFMGKIGIFLIGAVSLRTCWEKRIPVAIISAQDTY